MATVWRGKVLDIQDWRWSSCVRGSLDRAKKQPGTGAQKEPGAGAQVAKHVEQPETRLGEVVGLRELGEVEGAVELEARRPAVTRGTLSRAGAALKLASKLPHITPATDNLVIRGLQ
jgi:hypothetical protein